MAYLYQRPGTTKWWCRIKIGGKWHGKPTPYAVASDPKGKLALRYANALERGAQDRDANALASTTALTVRAFATPWIETRKAADLDWKNDNSRLQHHVLRVIGDMPIADVRAKHVADLVHRWRYTTKLAQRTVYNIYSTIAAMFRDAAIQGVIEQSPCILTKAQLGPLVDSDPEWRHGALFTRDEAEIMISHPDIPFDRRLYYAFGLLAGLRPGEIAALRVRHYEPSIEPLGRLTVALALNTRKGTIKGTKTGATRRVPVHPTLAAMLAEWLLSGWAEMMGRKPDEPGPGPDDLLLPLPPHAVKRRRSRKGEPIRTGDYAGKRWREEDLVMLGWRGRELYDTKSTFITLAIEDGADENVIRERVTHAKPRRNAFDGYDRADHWQRTCGEVAKLRITKRRVTGRVTVLATARKQRAELVEAAGVEISWDVTETERLLHDQELGVRGDPTSSVVIWWSRAERGQSARGGELTRSASSRSLVLIGRPSSCRAARAPWAWP